MTTEQFNISYQRLVSTFIRDAGVDEPTARKCIGVLGVEMFKNGLSYDYQQEYWKKIIDVSNKN
tara:strand:+ start:68 stop:259 length:192 start_codon:yes stop_codon:yes gene_type:complete